MAGPIKIPIILQNVGQGAGMVGGAAAGVAGRAAGLAGTAAFGAGGPGEITKGLGQIAKQLPAAGLMTDMAGAFKQGGPIAGITAGVSGMLGFVKSIMESSKVFQTVGGSFFKIFSAMADVFLLPFLPLAMKGMQMLLQHMPMISDWGQKAATWLEDGIKWLQGRGLPGAMMDGLNWLKNWTTGTAIPAVIEGAKTAGGWVWDKAQNWFTGIWEAIKSTFNIDQGTAQKQAATGSYYEMDVPGGGPAGYNEAMRTMSGTESAVYGAANMFDAALPFGSGIGDATEAGMGQWWALQGRHRDMTRREGTQTQGGRAAARGMSTEELEDFIMREGYDPTQARASRQLGGSVPGGPGQGVNMTLHGGEEIIPRDVVQAMESAQGGVLGGFFGTMGEQIFEQTQKINSYVQEFKTREGGAGGTIATFDAEVLEGDLPKVWSNIDDYLSGIGTQTKDLANAMPTGGMEGFGEFDINVKLPEFKPPTEALNEMVMCFETLQVCINANLEAMPLAVQNEATRIQGMLNDAAGQIEQGQGHLIDFDAIGAAINGLNSGIQTNINKTTSHINSVASEIHSLMGMSYEEFEAMDEGLFGSANYFGSAANQMGTYLSTMKEMAIPKQKPCTASQIEDPGNERCWGGCQQWMTTIVGHPCYIKPKPPKPPAPVVTEEDDWEPPTPPPPPPEPVDYGPGDFADIPGGGAGIHLPTDSGGFMAAAGAASALGPGGPMGLPEPVDYGPGDDIPSGIHQAYSAPASSGGFNFGGGPGGRGFYAGGIVPGRMGAPRLIQAHGGERIMPNSSPGSSRAATSNRVMNVTVNARGGLADVLGELQRFEDMDEASFFNSVL